MCVTEGAQTRGTRDFRKAGTNRVTVAVASRNVQVLCLGEAKGVAANKCIPEEETQLQQGRQGCKVINGDDCAVAGKTTAGRDCECAVRSISGQTKGYAHMRGVSGDSCGAVYWEIACSNVNLWW